MLADIAAKLPPPPRGGSPQGRKPLTFMTQPARCKDHDIYAVVFHQVVK